MGSFSTRRHDGRTGLHGIGFLPFGTLISFALAVAAVLAISFESYHASDGTLATSERMAQTADTIGQLQALQLKLREAETGQRGFLLTGAEAYLQPYIRSQAEIGPAFQRMRALLADNPRQQDRLQTLEQLTSSKFDELAATIELRRNGQTDAALAMIRTDRGKVLMENFRTVNEAMQAEEQAELTTRRQQWQDAMRTTSRLTIGGCVLLLALIGIAAVMAARDHRLRETQVWLRAGQAGLSQAVQGEQRLDALGDKVLAYLADYLGAAVGALYIENADGRFGRVAGHATASSDATLLRPGDGLLGEAVRQNRPVVLRDVPVDYLPVTSALGQAAPVELVVVPAAVDGRVYAAIELGFFHRATAADLQLLGQMSDLLAIAVRSSMDRTRLEDLLEETQRQSEALQTQQEELRVNNEELEEQGNALKASQAQLEVQQTELEQINTHLEEQAVQLEQQRDELQRSEAVLTDKAAELERASQYKTEFLANMSHELRTPLNSTLILAKLLADNAGGNLTEEQVRFAQTISGAGHDLLALINDILDLSKIEAGKVDLLRERVEVAPFVAALAASLRPLAVQKGLALETEIHPGTPAFIETDAQRLGQIVKNLLSNAIKFTEQGSVALRVGGGAGDDAIAFAVVDSGIGIAAEQHAAVFEAFRQADGSTHRKYGGTGLGLSISRDLAHLLGGEIVLHSEPGQGSTFTLTVPVVPLVPVMPVMPVVPVDADAASTLPPSALSPSPLSRLPPSTPTLRVQAPRVQAPRVQAPRDSGAASRSALPAPHRPGDDRGQLSPGARTILVIEDDVRFAAILRDLAHELHFQCVLATTAGEGLAAVHEVHPSAVVLDMNLPDGSGLDVLDQLKRDPRTRHIPVHVLSVADHAHDALQRGAIGYDMKPVPRAQLALALQRLEATAASRLRRVLVVEDDARQRDSLRALLAHADVEITGVATAGEALARLAETTYDCMVMDLSLPDFSGDELLQRMADQADASFPPVIVYTGRTLGPEEEQRLRRHSRSIILKDVRSPERLLDEVTLFLHQVETTLPNDRQRALRTAQDRNASLAGRRILVVEDDVRNIFALSSVLEPQGAVVELARNGHEALTALERSRSAGGSAIDLVLMDIMMPEMDGYTAMRTIRKDAAWRKLPIIALTAKAMRDDQERCLAAGANDYIAKPLDVEKLLSLVRVWMPQ